MAIDDFEIFGCRLDRVDPHSWHEQAVVVQIQVTQTSQVHFLRVKKIFRNNEIFSYEIDFQFQVEFDLLVCVITKSQFQGLVQ